MKTFVDRFLYGLIVMLALATLWLVLNAPPGFVNARVVYQGF